MDSAVKMRARDFSLSESFDSNVRGKLVRATNNLFTTSAEIGNRTIVFNAAQFDEGMDIDPASAWEIEFTEKTPGNVTYGKSGSGNEMQVFSFVIESIKELISRYHPDALVFGSSKADGNRTSLYTRMLGRIKIPGYHVDDTESSNYTDMFRIVKDNIN